MKQCLVGLVLSAGIVYAATIVVVRYAHRLGAVDRPAARRVHTEPIPNWGGLAIFLGSMMAILTLVVPARKQPLTEVPMDKALWAMILGGAVLYVTGAIDGIREIRAPYKLGLQIVAAMIAIGGGVRITTLGTVPGGYLALGPIWGPALTGIWIVGVTNAINLIDGLDGLAAGVCAIASGTLTLLALLQGQVQVAVIWAILCGACLGFLPHNFYPARIIMGDGGAYYLGFMMACVAVVGAFKTQAAIAIVIPVIALGIPIFDTTFAVARRLSTGQGAFKPDRKHIHHRLLDLGLTHRQVVIVLYAVSFALCAVSLLVYAVAEMSS
jgi:UDP-GlcNAc:undecaprenyl-phosphate GlcNAc-1-phosphate transferase